MYLVKFWTLNIIIDVNRVKLTPKVTRSWILSTLLVKVSRFGFLIALKRLDCVYQDYFANLHSECSMF